MRVLGIDFGERRIGIAISDPDGRQAIPLATLTRSSDREAIAQISTMIEREEAQLVVVGEPRNLDGSMGERARRTHSFVTKLRAASDVPCETVDERLTSVEARERLREAGVDVRRHPERVDSMAAQILLQQFLDERSDVDD